MVRFESVMLERRPDLVVVVGDVNSSLACALVAAKLCCPVAHVEAGLRSLDRTMPEEVNRVLTDHLADLLFTPSADADENLRREGISSERIHLVGNVMIDSLVRLLPAADSRPTLARLGLTPRGYVLVTLHRPSNVDREEPLRRLVANLDEIAARLPVVFPVHPRTAQRLERAGLRPGPGVRLLEPRGYLDFLNLQRSAAAVVTDSGGIQEETTYLGVPCLTVRPNTERPITIERGTNRLIRPGLDPLPSAVFDALAAPIARRRPPLWDGRTGERIVRVVASWADARLVVGTMHE
jgi:UDP-N-acetylglucosamine 2-epimerase (non-hydrolysing)